MLLRLGSRFCPRPPALLKLDRAWPEKEKNGMRATFGYLLGYVFVL